jgi:cyclase
MYRFFIITILIAFCTAALAQEITKQDFETVKVADGIFAFIANESNNGVVQGNVILIIGENRAVLVDSGQFPSLAERMSEKIRELTDRPVRLLVNTHWHGDHLLSNFVFKKDFPGLLVLAHEETERNCKIKYAKFDEQVKGYPKLIEDLRKMAKEGKSQSGRTLTDEEKTGLLLDAASLETNLVDLTRSHYEPADMTFQKEVSIDLGKRTVRILNLGWGNTAGDTLLFIPDAKVLVTGDTVVYPTPYSFGSHHGEWIEVLKKVIGMGADTYVPGHGPVLRDASYIQTLIALLEDVRIQVRAAVKENLSLQEVRQRVKLENWNQQLAGNDTNRRRAFEDFFLAPGIECAYKEAKGEPITE